MQLIEAAYTKSERYAETQPARAPIPIVEAFLFELRGSILVPETLSIDPDSETINPKPFSPILKRA